LDSQHGFRLSFYAFSILLHQSLYETIANCVTMFTCPKSLSCACNNSVKSRTFWQLENIYSRFCLFFFAHAQKLCYFYLLL